VLRALVLLMLVTGLAACDASKELPPDKSRFDRTPDQGILGVVNAIPDAPTLSVAYQGSRGSFGTREIAYGEGFAMATIIGLYQLQIGFVHPDGETVIIAEYRDGDRIDLAEDQQTHLVLTGTLNAPEVVRIDTREYLYGVVIDDPASFTAEPEIQIVHVAAGQPVLDFYLTAADADLGVGANVPAATLALGESSPIRTVEAGEGYRLRVTPQGDPATLLYDSGPFPVPATTRRTYFAFEHFGPGDVPVRVRPMAAQMGIFPGEPLPHLLRVSNLVADLAAVDVFLGEPAGVPAYSDVAFSELTAYLEQPPDTYDVVLTRAGIPDDALLEQELILAPGTRATLFVSGLQSDPANDGNARIRGALVTDDLRAITGLAQLRALHGAASAPTLDVFVVAPGADLEEARPLFDNIQFTVTGLRLVVPGEYDLVVRNAADDTLLIGPERITLGANATHLLRMADSAGGGPPLTIDLTATPLL
jgi:hypothetical protein